MTILSADIIYGQEQPRRRSPNSTTPESKVVAAVQNWAINKRDVYVVRVVQAGENGVADILMCVQGRMVGVECKAPKQHPRPLQMAHGERLTEAGGVFIWGDENQVIPRLNALYRGRQKDIFPVDSLY